MVGIKIVHPFVPVGDDAHGMTGRTPPARHQQFWRAWSLGWQEATDASKSALDWLSQWYLASGDNIGKGYGNEIETPQRPTACPLPTVYHQAHSNGLYPAGLPPSGAPGNPTATPVIMLKTLPTPACRFCVFATQVNDVQIAELLGRTTLRKPSSCRLSIYARLVMNAIIPLSSNRSDAQRRNRLYISYWLRLSAPCWRRYKYR